MKGKSSQNKFMKIIKMPIRALAKARDFYVRKMNHYADSGTYDGLGWGGPVYVEPMPRSLSTSTMRTTETDRDLTELVRAASTGSMGNRVHITSILSNAGPNKGSASPIKAQKTNSSSGLGLGAPRGVPRCGSVVMAKIEEDEPSNNNDDVNGVDNVVKKSNTSKLRLFPRSNSKHVGETKMINVIL